MTVTLPIMGQFKLVMTLVLTDKQIIHVIDLVNGHSHRLVPIVTRLPGVVGQVVVANERVTQVAACVGAPVESHPSPVQNPLGRVCPRCTGLGTWDTGDDSRACSPIEAYELSLR